MEMSVSSKMVGDKSLFNEFVFRGSCMETAPAAWLEEFLKKSAPGWVLVARRVSQEVLPAQWVLVIITPEGDV